MAGTDPDDSGPDDSGPAPEVHAHPLDATQLDGLLALSRSAHWNQTADDWRHMLATGRGWGLSLADGSLVASTIVLPYGPSAEGAGGGFAWVSMVLVLPAHRRRGFASRLLRDALAWLDARGLVPVLDATPAGHPVYRQEGFLDTWAFARYERVAPADREQAAPPSGLTIEPLHEAHWPAVRALDAPAFGADRDALLQALARRRPTAARVAVRDGTVVGWLLARPGRVATQLGPLVALHTDDAVALLDAALATEPGPVFVDVPDAQLELLEALRQRGFVMQRPFTRLVHPGRAASPPPAPGDARTVRLVAGPELG
jgi:GNAT superfamily N-acetyltransferase